MPQTVRADLLIIGMGAAAEMAALYAHDANPELKILIVTKALKGKGGCSRMVQGSLARLQLLDFQTTTGSA